MLLLFGLLAGCTSYEAQVEKGRAHAGVKRFFVLTNPNDGHAIDHLVAVALTNRGFEADSGPLTMMPDETEAIVSYQDRWTWDFGDHLVYLQIAVRDRKSIQAYANVVFSAKVPSHKHPADIVDDLVGRLLPGKKS
jgi:hypothetical protein